MNSLLVNCAATVNAAALHGTGTLDTGLDEELHGLRHKRATCDLFDFLGFGNSLCAAHCIGHGKAGGRCKDGVCHCR